MDLVGLDFLSGRVVGIGCVCHGSSRDGQVARCVYMGQHQGNRTWKSPQKNVVDPRNRRVGENQKTKIKQKEPGRQKRANRLRMDVR
jgi:hypothetical protein